MVRDVTIHPSKSLTNMGAAIFAVLAMWSVSYDWTATERYRSVARLPDYHSELVVFISAAVALFACATRASGILGKWPATAVGLMASAVALSASCWIVLFVVGDEANYISWRTLPHDAQFSATLGLTMAIASAFGMFAMFALHAAEPDLSTRFPETSWRTRCLALFAVLSLATMLMPWVEGIELLEGATADLRPTAVGIVSFGLLILVARRTAGRIDEDAFLGWCLGFAAIVLLLTVWYYIDLVGSEDPVLSDSLILFDHTPRLEAGAGLYLSLFAGSALIVTAHPMAVVQRLRSALKRPITARSIEQ